MNKRLVGLMLLSAVPLIAGLLRIFDVTTGALALDGHARFAADPLPAVLHVLGGTAFATLGVFQFVPSMRWWSWHRRVGRILAGLGVSAALAGLWMMWRWPPREFEGALLNAIRVVVAGAFIGFVGISVRAARHGDVRAHEAWMTRAYALWAGAGTQAFTLLPFAMEALGPFHGEGLYAALMAAGWLINLAVAEWALGSRAGRWPSEVAS
jgi:uncharacterized membrane protein